MRERRRNDAGAGRSLEGRALLTLVIAEIAGAGAISRRGACNLALGIAADVARRRKRPDRYRSERLVEAGIDHAPTMWRRHCPMSLSRGPYWAGGAAGC